MSIQRTFGKHASLAAAATLALGLATAGAAHAEQGQRASAADGDDTVDGDRGNDIEFLGSGDDTAVWLPGEGSDVVNGDGGEDALAFVGADGNEVDDLSASGHRVLFSREPGAVRMDLDGVEQLD